MKYLFLSTIFMLININYSYQIFDYKIQKFDEMPKNVRENLAKTGKNDSLYLNKYEIDYLVALFDDNLPNFEFDNKKICFFRSKIKSSKKAFFDNAKERVSENGTVQTFLLVLTDEQKRQSGYDLVILYWYKHIIMSDKELMNRLLK